MLNREGKVKADLEIIIQCIVENSKDKKHLENLKIYITMLLIIDIDWSHIRNNMDV